MQIIIATMNQGKVREIRAVLDIPGIELLTTEDLGAWPEPEETGATLEENATIKACALSEMFGRAALADDSGLFVDSLGGRPGVHSSRYAGPEGDAERNMDKLLGELEGIELEGRAASFQCVAALSVPGGEVVLARGRCNGSILAERGGTGGFGYDPIFLPDGFDRSMAQLTLEEKNAISHRGRALRNMREQLKYLGSGLNT
jgi:XTP/dITP diphosphohydrolase